MRLPVNVQTQVAHEVARTWKTRGIRSYSYEDLYQDAIEEMHLAAPKYDPSKGKLGGFLYRHCMRRLQDQVTRSIAPVSCRSHGDRKKLGSTKSVPYTPSLAGAIRAEDSDHYIYISQLRDRMREVASTLPDGELALQIALGLKDVRDVTQDTDRRKSLYKSVRKLKARMLNDLTLYRMANE